ncbi:MAG: TetR/AcrR family transcriptional regulator [Mycobacteriaceae bacterium]
MSADAAAAPRRLDRRKARTRAALVGAAQRFLADGKTNVSIQEITDAADVGFGSFYNHFSTKDELFAEAVSATLDTWGALRDKMVAGLDDPAEIFAMSFRMTGRLQRVYPELVRGLLNSGISVLVSDRGLRPRALADIALGIEQGRFTMPDPELGLMAAGGALLGLLQLLESHPDLDDGVVSDAFTERVLLMFGLGADEARVICTRTLPELPAIA